MFARASAVNSQFPEGLAVQSCFGTDRPSVAERKDPKSHPQNKMMRQGPNAQTCRVFQCDFLYQNRNPQDLTSVVPAQACQSVLDDIQNEGHLQDCRGSKGKRDRPI